MTAVIGSRLTGLMALACRSSVLLRVSRVISRRQLHASRVVLRAEVELASLGRLAGIVPARRGDTIRQSIGSRSGGPHSLRWVTPPRKVLIVAKPNDESCRQAARSALRERYSDLELALEAPLAQALDERIGTGDLNDVDLVLAIGGDGTLLHVASLFASGACPPIIGLSQGTLGFLMPFAANQLETALDDTLSSRGRVLLRMRLSCSVCRSDGETEVCTPGHQALNEVHLHRGRNPHLTSIETIVNDRHLTSAVADGLIVSTPTGSTAYSLSAGGPIVQPSVPSMLITPICPRSLSFRSVLLPSDARIEMRVKANSRSPVELSLDGREGAMLQPGESLKVGMSEYPIPCLVPEGDDTWLSDINRMLSFNKTFTSRGLDEEP